MNNTNSNIIRNCKINDKLYTIDKYKIYRVVVLSS